MLRRRALLRRLDDTRRSTQTAIKRASQNDLTPADFSQAFRYLTEHYFDRGHELSAGVKWLRDKGHPNLKLPALP